MSAPTSAKNKVVLAGAAQAGKTFILEKMLASAFPDAAARIKQAQADQHGSEMPLQVDWVIETKYYTADMRIWRARTARSHGGAPPPLAQLGEDCQAIVLVFDLHKDDWLEDLEAWAGFVDEFGPSVSLCVGNHTKSASVAREVSQKAQDWCLDHGYEFVEQPFDDSSGAALQRPALSFENETFGTDRVVEALQCNMWAVMDMGGPGGHAKTHMSGPSGLVSDRQHGRSSSFDGQDDNDNDDGDEEKDDEEEVETGQDVSQHALPAATGRDSVGQGQSASAEPDVAAEHGNIDSSNVSNDKKKKKKKKNKNKKKKKKKGAGAEDTGAAPASGTGAGAETGIGIGIGTGAGTGTGARTATATIDGAAALAQLPTRPKPRNNPPALEALLQDELEGDMEKFEDLVSKMRAVRAAAPHLSNEERHRRAEEALHELLAWLPNDFDDGDDDDDDGDASDDGDMNCEHGGVARAEEDDGGNSESVSHADTAHAPASENT